MAFSLGFFSRVVGSQDLRSRFGVQGLGFRAYGFRVKGADFAPQKQRQQARCPGIVRETRLTERVKIPRPKCQREHDKQE